MAKQSVRDRERSLRTEVEQSEQRNLGLVRYIDALEAVMKQLFLIAARQHDNMRLVIPGMKAPKKALAKICATALPFVQEVEDMKLTPEQMAALIAEGGELVPIMEAKQNEGNTER